MKSRNLHSLKGTCLSITLLGLLAIISCYRVLKEIDKIDKIDADIEPLNQNHFPYEQLDISNISKYDNYDNYNNVSRSLATIESHRVTSLPGLTPPNASIVHFAGHINVDSQNDGNIFYWLFESQHLPLDLPLVIWLNGGPGCSSMDGLWLEVGPFRLSSNNKVTLNEHSWHNVANMLFIDQPVGTGLSYVTKKEGLCKDDDCINRHFYDFLVHFFHLHTRYMSSVNGGKDKDKMKTRPLYFTGESHAGHYIPNMVQYILKKNEDPRNKLHIDVKAVAMGNPWIDPRYQYKVAKYAVELNLISQPVYKSLQTYEAQCDVDLKKGVLHSSTCIRLLDKAIAATRVRGKLNSVLMYDTRKRPANSGSFPPGHESLEIYLNRKTVKSSVHAESQKQKYLECADPPYFALAHQDGKGATKELVAILEAGVDVLIFSGQYDIVCNFRSTEEALDALEWSGRDDWVAAKRLPWHQQGNEVGSVRKFKNLQSVLVFNSGHMVPLDLPEVALDLFTRFLSKKSFSDLN